MLCVQHVREARFQRRLSVLDATINAKAQYSYIRASQRLQKLYFKHRQRVTLPWYLRACALWFRAKRISNILYTLYSFDTLRIKEQFYAIIKTNRDIRDQSLKLQEAVHTVALILLLHVMYTTSRCRLITSTTGTFLFLN